jgi:FAD/FMN-containing dehydrogenase
VIVRRVDASPLQREFDGEIIRTGDADYDAARRVWNAMVDRRPALIARCATVEDVSAAVRFARDSDLEIGVRCGGHSVNGMAVPEGGLMIDLTSMDSVRVDPDQRRAFVQGGALLGSVDRATQEHGLATPTGNVSHTGVGGLTLGGGMGWLARQFGLTCDNVTSFQLVTADGDILQVDDAKNPDLSWGLRGGGGNFGVVTEFELLLHQVGTQAFFVDSFFDPADATPVLRGWRDAITAAPRLATLTAWVGTTGEWTDLPPELRNRPLVNVGFVWVGDPADGRRLLPLIDDLGAPIWRNAKELTYLELQTLSDDAGAAPALRRYWKGHYLRELTDDAIEAFLSRGADGGTTADQRMLPYAGFQTYGGAIGELDDSTSAFSHRDALVEFVTASRWTDPGEDQEWIASARRYGAALEPYASGVYVNALSDEGQTGVRRAYSDAKLARLTALKDRYDPDNVFHLNHNIRPSAG